MSEQRRRLKEPDHSETNEQRGKSQALAPGTAGSSPLLPLSSRPRRRRRRDAGLFLLMLLSGIATLLILVQTTLGTSNLHVTPSASPGTSPQATTAIPTGALSAPSFHEYAFPSSDSQVMRLAMDRQGRLWFGAMGQNTLMMFDPSTHLFQHITPPQGRSGIMGIQVAADDSIWFAEQFANYIGHYFPATRTFHLYPLPVLSAPDPNAPGKTLNEPSGPNDLVLDAQGNVWFTEFQAGLVGQLDPRTGRFRHYALTRSPGNALALYPYGLTIDAQGAIWFTEMGGRSIGQLNPRTGGVHLFSLSSPNVSPMEIASTREGDLWITTFDAGLLLELDPRTGRVTRYQASLSSTDAGGLYGLVVAPNDDVWVTILGQNALARLDSTTHQFVYYRVPTANSSPLALIAGPHHTFWYSEIQQLGVLTFGGAE